MNRPNERGMALIITMIMLAVLSAMAVSFMFLSQSETWSTLNYRMMNQARDGAEAGINAAANFIVNTENDANKYASPTPTGGTDPMTAYTITTTPVKVTANNNPVVLWAKSGVGSNYPYATAQTNFNAAAQGNLAAGSATVNYQTSAALLSMRSVVQYGTNTPRTIQKWLITSDGSITGIRNAVVEVDTVLERPVMPTFNYAAFATSDVCGALDWGGGGSTDSYDSTVGPATSPTGGNIGTNGNLDGTTSMTINGSLSTPRAGIGACAAGGPNAWDGQGTITGGLTELPQSVVFPPPDCWANPATCPIALPPLTPQTINGNCPSGAGAIPECMDVPPAAAKTVNLFAGTFGQMDIKGGTTVNLNAGTYNFDSIKSCASCTLNIVTGPVLLNVAGCNTNDGTKCLTFVSPAIDFGGGISNPSLDPMKFQIRYAGQIPPDPSATDVKLAGTGTPSAVLYAPNANCSFTGGGNFYGSAICATVKNTGGTAIHYDRNLQNTAFTIGNFMLSSFTWKRF